MGTGSARITAADFVTPPELRTWRLADNPAGRIGGVRLELTGGPAGSRLGACYQQVPLRVLPPFQFGPGLPALLYLLNPTAGLLDGDAQLVEIAAGSGTRALVTGQSATRIHPSLHGFSTQQWRLRVAAGAVLVVLPGPAIPFQGCRYFQRVAIDLDRGAGLVWGDLWLAGRYARGTASEQFQFATLVQDLVVQRDGCLIFRDRFCWQGPWNEVTPRAWHFGTRTAGLRKFVRDRANGGSRGCLDRQGWTWLLARPRSAIPACAARGHPRRSPRAWWTVPCIPLPSCLGNPARSPGCRLTRWDRITGSPCEALSAVLAAHPRNRA